MSSQYHFRAGRERQCQQSDTCTAQLNSVCTQPHAHCAGANVMENGGEGGVKGETVAKGMRLGE